MYGMISTFALYIPHFANVYNEHLIFLYSGREKKDVLARFLVILPQLLKMSIF